MEYQERERLIRRINGRKLYGRVRFRNDYFDVKFTDPSLSLLVEADWTYNRIFKNLISNGEALTLEQSFEALTKSGDWTLKMSEELDTLHDDIKKIQSKINTLKYNKIHFNAAKKTLEDGKKRIKELEGIKNQLFTSSAEYIADRSMKRFIISKIVELDQTDLLDVPTFIDTLIVYYYKDNSLSESQIRELARTNPWRLYWTASKDTGTPLFPSSSVEMTELQYALVSWSRVYDFAYEGMNRPSKDIIEDDDSFDSWYSGEVDRMDNETRQNSLKNLGDGVMGGNEVFIPADEEGAKEVYKLNNFDGKRRVILRQKALSEKGELKEADLPDVKSDIVQEANRFASQTIKDRSS